MRQTRKNTKEKISKKYKKTRLQITQTKKKTRKINNIKLDNNSIRLVSIALLNTNQIKQLKDIYNKWGSRTNWTDEEIAKFVIDEKMQIKKTDIQREYYSFCMFLQNNLVGYIIGKKNYLLHKPFIINSKPNKFDLILIIGLDNKFIGQGIGTIALNLFIEMYKRKIVSFGAYARKAKLYSDIAPTNNASIKFFEKHNFHYSHDIRISGKPYRRYSRLVFV